MQERNVIQGMTAAFTAPLVEAWDALMPFLLFAFFLTFWDLRYGLMAAKKRGERIRRSRAIRRTLNKIVDFICYLSLAWCLGHTFTGPLDFPLLPVVFLAVIYGIEMSSVFDNYLEYKGIKKKVNLKTLLGIIFRKVNVEDFLEDKKEE